MYKIKLQENNISSKYIFQYSLYDTDKNAVKAMIGIECKTLKRDVFKY